MLNWTSDATAMKVMAEICQRTTHMAEDAGISYPHLDAIMDLDACHSNGCPLKLQELLETDDGNFAHDVFGIRSHIDRRTGQLQDCFIPRYAV